MLRLEKRPNPSQVWGYLAPILAVITTMIGGGVMFALLGKDPFEAIWTILSLIPTCAARQIESLRLRWYPYAIQKQPHTIYNIL